MSVSTLFGDLSFKKVRLNGSFTDASGDDCIAIGNLSGAIAQGDNAVAVGFNAGQSNQGLNACAYGLNAGRTSQGTQAVAIGSAAGRDSQGSNSVCVGFAAGRDSAGAQSVCIGAFAGLTAGASSICIDASGSSGAPITAAASRCYIRPIGSQVASSALNYNAATSEVHLVTSSRDHKHDIQDLHEDTAKVLQLEAKQFVYNDTDDKSPQYGYIAEEVAEVHEKFATYLHDKPFNINWNVLTTFLLEEVKKLRAEVDELKSRQ